MHEYLHDYADLVLWSRHAGILTPHESSTLLLNANRDPTGAQGAHQKALVLRETLFRLFSALANGTSPSSSDVEFLNTSRTETLRLSRLTKTGKGFSLVWEEPDSLERMLSPIILSAVDLLISDSVRRLRECDGRGCDWLFIDSSRNHLRRWCSMDQCGNRAKMHRRYTRQRGKEH